MSDKETVELALTGRDLARPERAFLVVHLDGGHSRLLDLPEGAEVTFGRSQTAGVVIDDERVSRIHAQVTREGPDVRIVDAGSRNGTLVNGGRITGLCPLRSGDEITIGPCTAVLNISTRLRRRALVRSMSFLEECLAAEVDRSQRYHRPLGLVMMRIAGEQGVADRSLDRVAAGLRRMDTLAEYGPDEVAIVVPEATRAALETTTRRLARLARESGDGLEVFVGIAVHPDDATHGGELIARARAALHAARQGAGEDGIAGAPRESVIAADEIVVADPQMRRVYDLAARIADASLSVLVLGETGVGKELVAEALHRKSRRAAKPIVKINCASFAENLLESELFGHERGAFTGADRKKIGFFEAAHGGTIFLDEIGELPLALQPKLLRVLERKAIVRVGGNSEVEADVRVVCATNRDLEEEVRAGRFREDLFFRVSAFTIVVPPLRDRRAEIALLANYFARRFAHDNDLPVPVFTPTALRALERHAWPGNVRELRNAVERAVVLSTDGMIAREHLPEHIAEVAGPADDASAWDALDVREHIAEVERAAIVVALESSGGNQTHAAQKLGLSRRALIYKLEKYGLKSPPGSGR